MKYMVFIPAYYAESTLAAVVQQIPEETFNEVAEILIQDDASMDETFAVAQQLTNDCPKITAIQNERNLRYGGTQKKAYQYAIDKGYDAVVMVHGDGQLPPEFLPDMMTPLKEGKADIVLGSRILDDPLGGGMPLYKYLGNRFLTWITNRVLNLQLTDYHTGYTAFSTEALQAIDYLSCHNGHEISSEVLIRAAQKDLRIVEIAVPTQYGRGSRSITLITSIRYGFSVLRMLLKEFVRRHSL